eukprot:2395216-Amphidinium_carterae.1
MALHSLHGLRQPADEVAAEVPEWATATSLMVHPYWCLHSHGKTGVVLNLRRCGVRALCGGTLCGGLPRLNNLAH